MRCHRMLPCVLALAGFVLQAAGQEQAPAPKPVSAAKGVAATVNGQPVPERALQAALKGVPADKVAEARADILNHFIDNMLIDQHLVQLRVEVPKADVDKSVAQVKEQLAKSGAQGLTFEKWLESMMLTEEEMRRHIAAELRWEKYIKEQVTDQVLRDYFTKNSDMFDGTMVRARHILLTPQAGDTQGQKARAELALVRQAIDQEVMKGLADLPATADTLTREKKRMQLLEDAFAKQAAAKSACPSKQQGGDIGYFPRAGSMVESFARTAFALKPYQMSEVVATQFGMHLILCTERKAGKETKFEEVKEAVREVHADRVVRDGLLSQLRPKAKIEIAPAPKP